MSQNIALKPRKLLPAKVRLFCAVSKSVHKNRYFFSKQEIMGDLPSWRNNLNLLRRMPKPDKSQTPRRSHVTEPSTRSPKSVPTNLHAAVNKGPFLKILDKQILEFSCKPIKKVQKFRDSIPYLPHRPNAEKDLHKTAITTKRTIEASLFDSGQMITLSKRKNKLSDQNWQTSTIVKDINYGSSSFSVKLFSRHKVTLKIFHRYSDLDIQRKIPECLDTNSEFYNPHVSADERFNKYMKEMKRFKYT